MNINDLMGCKFKAYLSGLNLGREKGYIYEFKKILNKFIESSGLNIDEKELKIELNNVDDTLFAMKKEKEAVIDRFVAQVIKMCDILSANYEIVSHKPKTYEIKEGAKTIKVPVSLIVKDRDGKSIAVQIKTSKSDLSIKKCKTYVGLSPELYSIYKVTGEKPMIYSLQAKAESSSDMPSEYTIEDPKTWFGKNVFLLDEITDELTEIYTKLINENVSRVSSKTISPECELCRFKDICQYEDTDNDIDGVDIKKFVKKVKLSETQKELEAIHEGEVRVIAGAGAGKTTSIVANITKMIVDKNATTENTLLITFTEKAGREMKEKLEEYLKNNNLIIPTDKFNIYTFNSFGDEMIKKYYQKLGFTEEPEVIDENENLSIIQEIMDEMPVVKGLNYVKPYFKLFNSEGAVHQMAKILKELARCEIKTHQSIQGIIMKEDYGKNLVLTDEQECINIFNIYNKYIQKTYQSNKITYNDQIHLTLKLLNDENIRKVYQEKYHHFIIDEFQDTNSQQMEMVRLMYLPGQNRSLMVVGDDCQSIYSFHGANIENFTKFNEYYPNSKDIFLTDNYRSTKKILCLAENIINVNEEQIKKSLEATVVGSEPKIIIENDRKEGLTTAVNEAIVLLNKESAKDIAILCRTRSELLEIRKLLNEKNIPNFICVSEFYKDDNAIKALSYLCRYLRNQENLLDLASYLTLARHKDFEEAYDIETFTVNNAALILEDIDGKNDEEMYHWLMELIDKTWIHKSNALISLIESEKKKDDASFRRLSNFLISIIKNKTNVSAESDERYYNAITLSTIHAAKGREWKNVIVTTYGIKTKNNEFIPEEIRALFVAVTRARRKLTLISDERFETIIK